MLTDLTKRLLAALLLMFALTGAWAQQADLEINTPAITALNISMRAHHQVLKPYYESGAVGLTRDGLIALHDANAVPLNQRQAVNAAVDEGNRDRQSLYREIARANNHPEWEGQVRDTFAQRWIQKARPGWWYQDASDAWKKK